MPQINAEVVVDVSPEIAFAVSQTTGAVRLRWDPFIAEQHLLGGADRPGVGVRTFTRSRRGPSMISRYVSYAPPGTRLGPRTGRVTGSVGMTMERGPWFFSRFGGGWRFEPASPTGGGTRARWKYTFSCRPRWLAPLAEKIGSVLLQRDIDARIAAFAAACEDPVVIAAVTTTHGTGER